MKVRYALQALLYLSERRKINAGNTLSSEIAEENDLPKKFLDTILLELCNAGILQSKKGRGGGYALRRPESSVMLGDVIRALGERQISTECEHMRNGHRCPGDGASCHICRVERQIQQATAEIIDNMSLLDLAVGPGIPFVLEYEI